MRDGGAHGPDPGITQAFHVKPWQCSTAAARPARALRPSPTSACEGRHFSEARPWELYLHSACCTLGDWPQVRTPGPAGCAGCFTWNPQAMLGGPPRASKPRGSPGWADRGRAPRLTPAGSDTQTDQAAPGLQRRSAAAPADPDAWMFHVEPEAVSRRSTFVGSGRPAVLSDEGSAAVLGDRRLSIRRRQVSRGIAPVFSSVAVAGRSGCPDGSDVSRGTGGGVGRDGALRFGRPNRMSRRGTAAIRSRR